MCWWLYRVERTSLIIFHSLSCKSVGCGASSGLSKSGVDLFAGCAIYFGSQQQPAATRPSPRKQLPGKTIKSVNPPNTKNTWFYGFRRLFLAILVECEEGVKIYATNTLIYIYELQAPRPALEPWTTEKGSKYMQKIWTDGDAKHDETCPQAFICERVLFWLFWLVAFL